MSAQITVESRLTQETPRRMVWEVRVAGVRVSAHATREKAEAFKAAIGQGASVTPEARPDAPADLPLGSQSRSHLNGSSVCGGGSWPGFDYQAAYGLLRSALVMACQTIQGRFVEDLSHENRRRMVEHIAGILDATDDMTPDGLEDTFGPGLPLTGVIVDEVER